MPFLKVPAYITSSVDAHKKWLQLLKQAEDLLKDDTDLQEKAAKGFHLKERSLPPEVLGHLYADYCDVINGMYDSYLNSVHLQRVPCILEIISVFMKRLYELRNELVHLITNDYIYVDDAVIQMAKTPFDVQIVIPYHIPLECREDSVEQLLQRMWVDAEKRKNAPPLNVSLEYSDRLQLLGLEISSNLNFGRCIESRARAAAEKLAVLAKVLQSNVFDDTFDFPVPVQSQTKIEIHESIPDVSEEYMNATTIQRHERFRQFFIEDYKSKCRRRKMYFADNIEEAPLAMKLKAASLIQMMYRRFMEIKRQRVLEIKRDILLGLIPDPYKRRLSYEEENNKMYERKRKIREKLKETYMRELQQERIRLIVYKKENQIDDITEDVRNWFMEWYYGYGLFPDYPYDAEGGTMLVVRGDYPTIKEKREDDELYLNSIKGKTKEQLKAEKKQAKADALLKEATARETQKKEAEQLFKLRCNPLSDPGYRPKVSEVTGELVQALQKYRAAWSIYDKYPPAQCPQVIYGYMKDILTEDLMSQLHRDCRKYVDELMRLDLKLLIKMQQEMYKRIGWNYPKLRPRRKPKYTPPAKPLKMNDALMENLKNIFDLNIISKPTAKIMDIIGDLNYAAYDINLRDPDATFPPPGFGDVRRRLTLSCVFGSGIEPGAVRNKAVMLLGPERNGKSFMVDAVCGELNAVKIDISPEVFSAIVDNPARSLADVFLAAKVFQPAVIYMRNVERVFSKKVPPEEKGLQAKVLRTPLAKCLKQMLPQDKIIFIATCSNPFVAQGKPMVSLFSEVILVPRSDYDSLRLFFYERLQKISSMPREYCVQSLAQVLQGYGFGVILELFDAVLTAERIVRLNVTPLSPAEFLDPLFDTGVEATTLEEYREYSDFFIATSPLQKEREDLNLINKYRAVVFNKLSKLKKDK